MKSNNMDSRGSAVVVALQCQHTSINNLIKSFMVNTLFQLPYFFQTGLKALGWILPQPLESIFVLRLHRFQQRTSVHIVSYYPSADLRFLLICFLVTEMDTKSGTWGNKTGGSVNKGAIVAFSLCFLSQPFPSFPSNLFFFLF
ncbi:hypothetical protein fugu_015897 [Takifugu bimaculatus]|uniref:Uncharacterized protein n=1 Tax=Takifugu bimaculatus TaxID=433685 RepID=A0A4Z2BXG0_9TELE|nr:hypothetical protein fugu_015897 [Takifugu bimaculatus]